MRERQPLSDATAELLWGSGAAALAFAVYLATGAPSLNFIDSGELSTVATTLGIAHPTGYPLFTLLGWLFARLPFGFRVITNLNIMSAFLTAAALLLYFKLFVYLLTETDAKAAREKQTPRRGRAERFLPALAGTLLLAFSETYWSQGLAIEVYSLHLFMVGAVLLLFAKGVKPSLGEKGQSAAEGRKERLLLQCFAFALGLSFSNHMTTIFLAPACLYLFFSAYGFAAGAWRRILWMSLPFLLGLSLYLYLPFRAAEHPLMNWGNPATWDAFLRHTSAKQYSVWLFSSGETARRQLSYFLSELPAEFAYAGLLLALAGAWGLFRRHRKLFVFTVLLFLGCVLYAINYDIHDIDSYFLLAYVTVALWAAFGAREIAARAGSAGARRAAALVALLAAGLEGGVNARAVTLRDMTLVEDYTRDMFRSVAPNAVVISYQWDYFVSAAYYLQRVEGVRPDVVVIDKELMRRTWYYAQLEHQYPWLIANSRAEVDAFMVELRKFEHGLPYNPQVIEYRFASLIRSFIERSLGSRPVFVTPEIEPQYTAGFRRVPSGLADRLVPAPAPDTVAVNAFDFQVRLPGRRDTYVDGVVGLYAQAYLRAAAALGVRGQRARAGEFVARALALEPGMPEALMLQEDLKKEVKEGG
jgi:hypothetical protein